MNFEERGDGEVAARKDRGRPVGTGRWARDEKAVGGK